MNYTVTIKTIVHNIHTCTKCGKKFIFTDDPQKNINTTLADHTKQCTCNHSWSDWNTSNLGTWPDYEPYTTRRCNKCGKQELL